MLKRYINSGANHPAPHSVSDKLRRFGHLKLRGDSMPMRFRSLLANAKYGGDLLHHLALTNELENFPFAKGQRIRAAWDVCSNSFQSAIRAGIQVNDTSANSLYSFRQLTSRSSLQNEASHPGV